MLIGKFLARSTRFTYFRTPQTSKFQQTVVQQFALQQYLPENLQTRLWGGKFLGQKQRWFLFSFQGTDKEVNLQNDKKPEFNNWQWVSPQDVLKDIVNFKKEIYQKVLKEFELITL